MLHNKLYDKSTINRKPTASPQQVVEQTTGLTTSWTTYRTASPLQVACNNQQVLQHVARLVVRQIHSTASRTNGVRH